MVDVSIKSLIQMAQKYVENAHVDTDRSGTINTDKELSKLLTGTGAASIEELTVENIAQKIRERDTEKVFTAFITTDNQEKANTNEKFLTKTRQNVKIGYEALLNACCETQVLIMEKIETLYQMKDNLTNPDVSNDDKMKTLEEYIILSEQLLSVLDLLNDRYKNAMGQNIPQIEQYRVSMMENIDKLSNVYNQLKDDPGLMDSFKAKTKQIEGFIQDTQAKFEEILMNMDELKEQYQAQKEVDENFIKELIKLQHEENVAPEMAKNYLQVMIDNVSPAARNIVIKYAEMTYEPNTPSDVDNVAQGNSIKRSSYKTPTEIYTLRGNDVIVSDYSGKLLRHEPLDTEKHRQFFE